MIARSCPLDLKLCPPLATLLPSIWNPLYLNINITAYQENIPKRQVS